MKTILKEIARPFVDAVVRIKPSAFASALRRNHPEQLFGVSYFATQWTNWKSIKLPTQLRGFEDLSGLFFVNQSNRGIIMQDFDEAALLYRSIKCISNPIGIEIGRFRGGSTVLLAYAVGESGKLYSLDISSRFDDDIRTVLTRLSLQNRVELVVADSASFNINSIFDFVFIDGDHGYLAVKKDYNQMAPRLKVGGLIIFHDMANTRPFSSQADGPKRLREELISLHSDFIEIVEEAGSMSVWRRLTDKWSPLP